ncbi:MAG: sensor domain-containing phosphodiesterase [Gammaproteobacteria bacterium]|nr:sensor domain-containing phosphodiesterase [Gammaproteobacteria bacterium]
MASTQPVIPANELERLAELVDLDILDTESEEVFDGLTKLAAFICGTPISLVSLVDAERQWFKSRHGLAATETPRDIAFCAHAINEPEQLFVVPDALADRRFRNNPLVTSDPSIRFYAGMPITTKPGSAIGTLCVLDRVPRELSDAQRQSLTTIAGAVGAQLNLRREISIAKTLDAVTGLPNSFAFERKFIAAAPRLRQGGLLLIGMERLNKIVAALGSRTTDMILVQSTQRLKTIVPDGTILAFFRRGLFVLFVPDAGPAEVSDFVVQKLAPALAAPYTILIGTEEQQIHCPPHIGASYFPGDGMTMDALLISAEQALQSARTVDEPFRAYDKSTDEIAGQHFRLEAELYKALDREEFVNYYQPKIDLATGKICGAEALLRWVSPTRGLVMPMQFIPALESSGLIVAADRQVLCRAVTDWYTWRKAGLGAPRIAVNVTAAHLKTGGFVHDIDALLKSAGSESAVVSMEVTEGTLMTDRQRAFEILSALRNIGIPIAIDDFGTGYSSLAYLVTLPIDELKIDRAFVIKMTTDSAYLGIVSTIITLAHNLNFKVVAEGVETEEQANLLRLLKCDQAQGYLYNRPVSAENFAALLTSS